MSHLRLYLSCAVLCTLAAAISGCTEQVKPGSSSIAKTTGEAEAKPADTLPNAESVDSGVAGNAAAAPGSLLPRSRGTEKDLNTESQPIPAADGSAAKSPEVDTSKVQAHEEVPSSVATQTSALTNGADKLSKVLPNVYKEQEDAASLVVGPVQPSASANSAQTQDHQAVVDLCKEIGNKLGSVSVADCLGAELFDSGGRSRNNRSIALKSFIQADAEPTTGKVLLMGGIHGDEFSSISIVFKWLKLIKQKDADLFSWQVVPLLNPDGLLRDDSQRQNQAGVDLNRNFPSPDWQKDALRYWRDKTASNPRRYPGPDAGSEPETQWLIQQIEEFKPDAIVAVHAPHSLVDYDGPQQPPHKLGTLRLYELGVYPGSLGNYAGIYKNIPVVTIELPSAGIMPSNNEVTQMWGDLVDWLQREVPKQSLARLKLESDGQ